MNISRNICSMSQAVSILSAGIEHKTLYYWMQKKDGAVGIVFREHLSEFKKECAALYPAYTIADLLGIVGDGVALYKEKGAYCCSVHKSQYPLPDIREGFEFFIVKSDTSGAEALAAMLIILRKNGMV